MALSFVNLRKKPFFALSAVAAALLLAPMAQAQNVSGTPAAPLETPAADAATEQSEPIKQTIAPATVLGDYRAWSAYSARDNGLICFARSTPTNRSAAAKELPPAYVYITHRPSLDRRNVVSIVPGYDFATGGEATLTIGGQSFVLLTRQNAAWLKDLDQTPNLITAMRKGISMTMVATSSNGSKITDTYSLSGVTRATNAIAAGCDIS